MKALQYLLGLLWAVSVLNAAAQPAIAQTSPGATPTLAQLEKQWKSCEDGYYTGPRAGRRNYTNDKYLWVVTEAFAKRFCMPESLVSKNLKGAEAIAFRMVDGADAQTCGVDDNGKAHCSENNIGRFEIYLPQSLNLPAANPEVKFFEGGRTTSDWHLPSHERGKLAQLYRKGQYKLPPGEIPRFRNPYLHPDPGYQFMMIYSHLGKGRWPVKSLWEVGYRADRVQGLDMLILEAQIGMGFDWETCYCAPENVKLGTTDGQYLIVMDQRDITRIGVSHLLGSGCSSV